METHSSDDAQGDDSGPLGVTVQVQGINGRPFVVLNSRGRDVRSPDYPDVFHTDGQQQAFVSQMSGSAASIQTPQTGYRPPRSIKNLSAPLLNYQKNPELLRPYDPRNISMNNQSFSYQSKPITHCRPGWSSSPSSPASASPVMVKRARIPVPAAGRDRFQDVMQAGGLAVESVPCQPSHIICRRSAPATDDQETHGKRTDQHGSPRIGRVGKRSRIRPEEKRRSRSAESRVAGSDQNNEMFKRTETDAGTIGTQAAQPDLKAQITESRTHIAHQRSEVQHREKTESSSRTPQNNQSNPKREEQVTPDLLRGQRVLQDQLNEETVKLSLLKYLRGRNAEGEDVIRQRVELMFEKIHMIRSRTADTLEEFELLDFSADVKQLQDSRAALEREITQLKQRLEAAVKESESVCEERERTHAELQRLQETLDRNKQQQIKLTQRLTDMEKELQSSLDQLLQAKRSRDQCRADVRHLQQQLSDIHDELDSTKSSEAGERDRILQDLSQLRLEFQALQQVQEEQEDVLRRRERELSALQGALEEEISSHTQEVKNLKEEHQQEIQMLLKATEEAKESVSVLGQKVLEVVAERGANQNQIRELTQSKAELQNTVSALKKHVISLNDIIQQNQILENRLKEHVEQLMVEKQNLEVELEEVHQQEEDMSRANRAVTRHLEDTQSELSVLNRAHRELKEKLQQESRQMEELIKMRRESEDEMKKQNRETESLQEELCVLKDKLSLCVAERDEAELKTKQMQKRTEELEEKRNTQDDKHIKVLESRVLQLEGRLEEEQNSTESLMKSVQRGHEQLEQVRAELLQERSARQDLECDKISLERQNNDLRSRVCQRSGPDVSKLQLRIQELEEKLSDAERENGELQQTIRKQERKMKETMLHLEEKQLSLQDQRDQLLLRLKVFKRQLDETEEETDRLMKSKKQLQRDVEEEQQLNEQLQTEISSLRTQIRRNQRLQNTDEDEDEEQNTTSSD